MSELLEVASQAERVKLFEDRAEVRRRAQAAVPAGLSSIRVTGVSVVVDDGSLLAGVAPSAQGARVLDARVLRRASPPVEAEARVRTLEDEREAALTRVASCDSALGRASADQMRSVALSRSWIEAVRRAPASSAGTKPAADLAASAAALAAALVAALDEVAAQRLELQQARTELARVEQRLAEVRSAHPRFEALVELQVESPTAATLDLELTYRTPCALWRPEHQAQLVEEGGKSFLVIRTWATAWQRTGEDWTDVRVAFSTARPSGAASPPLLTEDRLELRRRAPDDKTIAVQAREQAIEVAGLSRGTRQVAEMPGVDDGGEPLRLEAAHPVTLPGDGRPFRVELLERRMECRVECVAFPERSEGAFIRATATWSGPEPLLAGPVWACRDKETMGLSKVRFVAAGEPFELGFGVEDGIRVRRQQEEKQELVALTGTQRLTRTVKIWCSNLSGSKKTITLTERVPVSEIADLEIKLLESGGGRLEAKEGRLEYAVELEPRATVKRELSYRIDAGKNVRLPG